MKALFDFLIQNNISVAVAESCTGGNIAASFVSYPCISRVFLAGIVAYANSIKAKVLKVKKSTLAEYGAVSEECAKEMLRGVVDLSGADAAICTTGIAGPNGGTNEKPVGLVYVGVYYKGEYKIERCLFSGDRGQIINSATEHALSMLYNTLKEKTEE